jgi:hypothetical protein
VAEIKLDRSKTMLLMADFHPSAEGRYRAEPHR